MSTTAPRKKLRYKRVHRLQPGNQVNTETGQLKKTCIYLNR